MVIHNRLKFWIPYSKANLLLPCCPVPLVPLFPCSSCSPVPLFLLLPCSPVPLVPSPVPLFPCSPYSPCSLPCSPIPCFPCSPVPLSLAPLFPLFPCSPCSPCSRYSICSPVPFVPLFRALDSVFQRPGFRIPPAKINRISESNKSPHMGILDLYFHQLKFS